MPGGRPCRQHFGLQMQDWRLLQEANDALDDLQCANEVTERALMSWRLPGATPGAERDASTPRSSAHKEIIRTEEDLEAAWRKG